MRGVVYVFLILLQNFFSKNVQLLTIKREKAVHRMPITRYSDNKTYSSVVVRPMNRIEEKNPLNSQTNASPAISMRK